ncbi:hypothetical protein [Paenibacillus polymyxa]|nr:hypothetical protein [Paenibacillus polymyxa]
MTHEKARIQGQRRALRFSRFKWTTTLLPAESAPLSQKLRHF